MTTDLKSMVRNLADRELKQLESLVRAEIRRRKKIVLANAGWTSGEGLEPVLEASVQMNKKWGIYMDAVTNPEKVEDFGREYWRSSDHPDTFDTYSSASEYVDRFNLKGYHICEVPSK